MDETFFGQFEALMDKYTELLLGQTNEELKKKSMGVIFSCGKIDAGSFQTLE